MTYPWGGDAPASVHRPFGNRPAWPATLRRRWDGVPLRARLVAILLVALTVALLVTGWAVQAVLRGYLVGQVDDQLRTTIARVGGQRGMGAPGTDGAGPSPFTIQITYDARPGGSVAFLPGPPGREPREAVLPTLTSAQAQALGTQPYTVAQPLSSVDDAVNRLRLLTLEFGLVVVLACALLGWLAIRRAFVPLVEVEHTAAAIAGGDLSRRIPERPSSTEVGRLTRSLNGMLSQIESAFRAREASEARTRRFAADASHELRTPLASIRGFAELYRQGAVPPDEVPRTMGRIEDEARRMGSLVEDLLLLARLDEQRPTRSDPVDLAVIAGDAVHDARGLDPGRTVSLVGLRPDGGPVPAVVRGDEDRLRQVVANLVANAVRHTPAGTPIEVAVGVETGSADGAPGADGASRVAVLEVRDHGAGLAPEQASRVFERFYRVDASRQRGRGGGSGLGLSIVAAVVAAHRGTVQVTQTPGGGATFRVQLPADEAPTAPGDG